MADPDVGAAVDWSLGERRSAIGQSIVDLDENPDDAARSVDLGIATGVPPILINRDLDHFERQHKAGIVSGILNENENLRNWIRQNPMASRIANDDWGQLDQVSKTLGKMTWSLPGGAGGQRIVEKGLHEASEGFGNQAFGSWAADAYKMEPFGPAAWL